jgi:4-amino-4-deoxy-L-arabinose transferase-like glycosyltransferase
LARKDKIKGKRHDKVTQDEPGWSGRLASLFGSKKIDILIPVIFFISFINSLRAAVSQYYILEYPDDIVWVSWASKHFNEPLAILLDKQGTGLRPMINFLYAIGYSVWGSNATYYYLMNGVLFAGAMVFLYLLIKQLHSRAAGIIAVFLYLFLDASFILVWKMNYTTSIAEMFFITSSLYYSIHFFDNADKKSLVLAFVLGIFAFLSKEPSILIIPAVNIIYLLHKWKSIEAKTRIASLLVNVSLPLLFLLLTFMVSSEVNAPRTSPLLELIKSRLVTYFELELSTTQGQLKNPYLIFLACTGAIYFHKFNREEFGGVPMSIIKNAISILIIAVVFISSQSLYSPTGAILIVLLLALAFIFGDINRRLGIAWFGVGLAPLLITSQQVQPTYLAEANLGMSLFIGVTVSEYLKYIFTKENSGEKSSQVSSVFKTVNIVIVVLILVLQISAIPPEISNTNNYQKVASESQTSFKEAVDYVKTSVPENGSVYYIPSEEREKVGGSQITPGVFYDVLCMQGRCDIEVKNLLPSATNMGKNGFIVLLSNLDAYIFNQEYSSLNNNVYILKQIKNGDSVAYILGVKSA